MTVTPNPNPAPTPSVWDRLKADLAGAGTFWEKVKAWARIYSNLIQTHPVVVAWAWPITLVLVAHFL